MPTSQANYVVQLSLAGASKRAIAVVVDALWGWDMGNYVGESGTVDDLIKIATMKATIKATRIKIKEFWAVSDFKIFSDAIKVAQIINEKQMEKKLFSCLKKERYQINQEIKQKERELIYGR